MRVFDLQGKKGIWINLPLKYANLVEAAVSVRAWFI